MGSAVTPINFDQLAPGDIWTYALSPYEGHEQDALGNAVFEVIESVVYENCTMREFGRAMRVRRFKDHKGHRYQPPTITNHMPLQKVWLLSESESK